MLLFWCFTSFQAFINFLYCVYLYSHVRFT